MIRPLGLGEVATALPARDAAGHGGVARLVWTSAEAFNAAVGDELHEREKHDKETSQMPHWLVINDQRRMT